MSIDPAVEIGIAATLQLGGLIWFLSGMKSDLKNLTGWHRSTAHTTEQTRLGLVELRAHVRALPCARCENQKG